MGESIQVAAPDGTSLEPQGVFGVDETLYVVEESGVCALTDW